MHPQSTSHVDPFGARPGKTPRSWRDCWTPLRVAAALCLVILVAKVPFPELAGRSTSQTDYQRVRDLERTLSASQSQLQSILATSNQLQQQLKNLQRFQDTKNAVVAGSTVTIVAPSKTATVQRPPQSAGGFTTSFDPPPARFDLPNFDRAPAPSCSGRPEVVSPLTRPEFSVED